MQKTNYFRMFNWKINPNPTPNIPIASQYETESHIELVVGYKKNFRDKTKLTTQFANLVVTEDASEDAK
jgi:hypothetical protein